VCSFKKNSKGSIRFFCGFFPKNLIRENKIANRTTLHAGIHELNFWNRKSPETKQYEDIDISSHSARSLPARASSTPTAAGSARKQLLYGQEKEKGVDGVSALPMGKYKTYTVHSNCRFGWNVLTRGGDVDAEGQHR